MPHRKDACWLCECSCGNRSIVSGKDLRQGKSTKCELCRRKALKNDLTGKTYNRLTVIREALPNEHNYKNERSAIWLCKCSCGSDKKIYARGTDLIHNHVCSCGCYNKEMSLEKNSKDMSNQQFGELLALERTEQRRNGSIIWKCLCSCGKTTYVAQNDLNSGRVKSCGHKCFLSQGEQKIAHILTKASVKFETQKTFISGKYPKTNRLMRFDFWLPDYNILIEYDGEQHFRPVEYFGGKKAFLATQERDNYKNFWCKTNNIKLIRIPYTEYDNITINTFIPGGEKK